MNKETKICQNCSQEFMIEPEDFAFYEKISVSPPTFCPECRQQRRYAWRNEKTLYKRKCDATGKDFISMFPPDTPFPVYERNYWWSDNWDPTEYGKDYDWGKPFFEQFGELTREVPKYHVFNSKSINSEYCNFAMNLKNCYLLFGNWLSEDCIYGDTVNECKDCVDNFYITKCERTAYSIDCQNCYQVFYSQNSSSCMDSWFLFDCRNCQNCLFSTNLRNKQYYIFNKQTSKKEFEEIKSEFIGSLKQLEEAKNRFEKELKKQALHRFMTSAKSYNVTGNFIFNSQNIKNSYSVHNSENVAFGQKDFNQRDSMDVFGTSKGELIYESTATVYSHSSNSIVVGDHIIDSSYLADCFECKNCFGCIGLRHKKYCILNKQYTKEEYEELVPKIIQHMNKSPYEDKKGRIYKYGEFFPVELSPFAYNETPAQEYFPLTKEEAQNKGYTWKEPERRDYQITIKPKDLPDTIKDVPDSIVNEIIGCEHEGKCQEQCTTAFKIIKPELEFYKKMDLPLPRLCPNCRHYQRIKQRNPLKLWHRKCKCAGEQSDNGVYKNTISHNHGKNPCPNEFETTYSSDRPEIVYCEKCYQQEVV